MFNPPHWKVTILAACLLLSLGFCLGTKLLKDRDLKTFQVWEKQTGNTKNLTFEEWRLVRRELRYQKYD